MPIKIKQSNKRYTKDIRGRMTNKFQWIHYTVANTKTEELLKYRKSLPRKRNVIERELTKRGVDFS